MRVFVCFSWCECTGPTGGGRGEGREYVIK